MPACGLRNRNARPCRPARSATASANFGRAAIARSHAAMPSLQSCFAAALWLSGSIGTSRQSASASQ